MRRALMTPATRQIEGGGQADAASDEKCRKQRRESMKHAGLESLRFAQKSHGPGYHDRTRQNGNSPAQQAMHARGYPA